MYFENFGSLASSVFWQFAARSASLAPSNIASITSGGCSSHRSMHFKGGVDLELCLELILCHVFLN
jgi:hypothetical protein